MATALTEPVRRALEAAHPWHLATLNPDGSPQVTPVWADVRDGRILVNTALGRKKPRNLKRDGRVALSWTDPNNPYESAAIQGRVVDSYEGDEAERDIDRLAKKYLGEDRYPWRQPGERRVTFLIEPSHVWHLAGG